MKKVTKTMVTMLAVLCAACSLVAADQQSATEDIAAFEAGLQAIASKPKLMSAKLLSATSGTTVYPSSNSDMNKTGNHTTPLDLYFDVTMASVSSATLYLNAYDVDYPSATEDDEVYFNGTPIGRLQGYDGGMNLNTFNLPANIVKIGSNHVHIDVSVNPSGWITQIREGTKLVLNGEEGRVTLTVSKDLLNKIELNWSANYSGAAPYNIYRGKTSDNLTIYREGLTVTSFTDTDIVPGDTYYYQIKTKSGVSSTIEGAKSVKGVVTVIASQDLYHKVQLSWTTENCTGPFTIYRGETEEGVRNPQQRTTVVEEWNAYTYVDDKVNGGQDYYYLVVASNGAVNDPVAKGMNRRAEVKLLEVSDDLTDYIKLTWSCPVKDLEYKIYKSTSREGPFRVMPEDYWWDREDYKDSSCEIGGRYYYYVKSSLGVDSDIKEGRRIRKYEEPEISSLEMNHTEWFKGQNNYVAGDDVVFTIGFNTKGQRAKLRCLHVYHEGYDRPAYRGRREIGNEDCKDVEISDGGTYTVRVKLPTGSGGHGMFYFSVVADMLVDGHSCSIKNKDKLDVKRPVYFNKDIGDNGVEANWFNYWKEDGACPRLRQSKPKVVFAGVYKDVVKGSMVDAGLRYPDIYSDLAGAYGGFSNGHEDEVFIRTCEHGWITKAETMIEPWDYARYVVLNGREYDMWSTKMCKIGVDIVQKIIAHETRHWRTWHDYITELERHYGRRVGDLTKDDVYAVDSDFYEIEDDKWMAVIEKLKKSGGLVSLSVLKRVAPMVECGDRLTDNAEKRLNEELGIASQTKRFYETKADSFNLASMLGGSYRTYGDNEFLSRVAEIGVVGESANDWSSDGWLHDHFEELESRRKLMSMGAKLSSANDNEETEATNSYGYVSCECASLTCVRNENDDVSGVVADIRFEFTGQGPCCVLGYLADSNTNEYVVASCTTEFSDTNKNVRLNFEGTEISRAKLKGPLRLGAVLVSKINPYARDSELVGVDVDFPNAVLNVDYTDCERLPGCIVAGSAVDISTANEIAFTYKVEANIATDFVTIAMLYATNGTFVSQASVTNSLSVGTNTICVAFDAGALYRAGVDGPYEVKTLQLWQGGELVDAMADVLSIANAYDYHSFEPSGTCVFLDESSVALEKVESGALLISFDVSNVAEETLDYEFSCAILGVNDERVTVVAARHLYLEKGINHISEKIASSVIAESGVDGPYRIASILLKPAVGEGGNEVVSRLGIQSPAYKASDFAAAAVAFSDKPSAKGVLECDTPTVVLPFEAKCVCTVVASATLIGTNGEFIARASATNRCDAAGVQAAEIVFPREALVAAGQRGPFSVGYFALLPLVDGEEPIYSDTFEVTGVEWIDWEGMFDWAFEGGTAQAALYKGTNGVVRVPSFVKGRDVISVGPCCFLDCECVAEIILPVGIAEVGIGAFFGTSLSAVELPESVATVGNAAFNVEGLELVVFDGPPPMSAPDAYPKGAVGTYSAAYAATWEAELKGGCLWNGLTMVPEGADADGYRTESGWTVIGPEDAAACEGKRTFRSAETADGASSAMTMDVEEQTSVSFWWKTSCEGARMDDWQGDHAEFLIDGVVVERIAGESCWKQVVVNISDPGQHELSWRYVKDGAGASGADCVWVSDLGFATAAGEMTHAELLAEADYNWFYENGPVECGGETPFEYIPEKPLPERTLAQIDILCDLGIRSVVDTEDAEVSDSAQTAFCRCANGEGLDFAVWTADGWMRVGNALVGAQQGEARVTICLDYSVTPSQFACKVNNHTLTNENGQSSFVCAKQDCRVNEIATDSDGAGRIVAWAGRYDASNSEILEIAEGTEAECDSDLSNLPRETFQVSGGGTLVIKGADVPTAGVKARLHVDQNSALRFDYSGFSSLPSVLTLFSGVGNDFMLQGNVSIVVPGEGSDRLSKLCVKDGNLEAHIAERPEIVTEGGSESPFAVDGENGSACLNVGNAVEGFWYGLLTTGVLTSDFVLDPDSVKQCTGTGSLRLESSVNANSDSGFYRVSVSAEKP